MLCNPESKRKGRRQGGEEEQGQQKWKERRWGGKKRINLNSVMEVRCRGVRDRCVCNNNANTRGHYDKEKTSRYQDNSERSPFSPLDR